MKKLAVFSWQSADCKQKKPTTIKNSVLLGCYTMGYL